MIGPAFGETHSVVSEMAIEKNINYYDVYKSFIRDLQKVLILFQFLQNFKGYDFFLLQDLVEEGYSSIQFWHQFSSFEKLDGRKK